MHTIGNVANALSRLNAEYIETPSTQKQINRRNEGMYLPASGQGLLRSLKSILQKRNQG